MASFPSTITRTDLVDGTSAEVADINPDLNSLVSAVNSVISGCNTLNTEVSTNTTNIAAVDARVVVLESASSSSTKHMWQLSNVTGSEDTTIRFTADVFAVHGLSDNDTWEVLYDVDASANIQIPGTMGGRMSGVTLDADAWYDAYIAYSSALESYGMFITKPGTGPGSPPNVGGQAPDFIRFAGSIKTDATSHITKFYQPVGSDTVYWRSDNATDGQILSASTWAVVASPGTLDYTDWVPEAGAGYHPAGTEATLHMEIANEDSASAASASVYIRENGTSAPYLRVLRDGETASGVQARAAAQVQVASGSGVLQYYGPAVGDTSPSMTITCTGYKLTI